MIRESILIPTLGLFSAPLVLFGLSLLFFSQYLTLKGVYAEDIKIHGLIAVALGLFFLCVTLIWAVLVYTQDKKPYKQSEGVK